MLRRALWFIPTLFAVSLVSFQFLAWTLPVVDESGDYSLARPAGQLPVFFNPAPDNAGDLALSLMKLVADGGPRSVEASARLARLGGAALPHVLPRLDELRPKGRARVSLALAPIAQRMGLGNEEELKAPEAASLFWNRFWQDREFDFRPTVVRRLVKRVTERSLALRRDDLIQLDTYALPELIKALGFVRNRDDVERVHRLSVLLSHITGQPWVLPEQSSLAAAQDIARRWQAWWLSHGDAFVSLDGISKATAMVTQTRYGRWLRSLPLGLGTMADGSTVLTTLKAGFVHTLLLFVCGALGGYSTGALLAVHGALFGALRWVRAQTWLAWVLCSIPLALMARALAWEDAAMRLISACLLMVVTGASTTYLYSRAALKNRRSTRWWPEASRSRSSMLWALRAAADTPLALLATCLPTLLLAVALLEHVHGLPGLGATTIRAVATADSAWLMVIALLGSTLAAALQMLCDAAMATVSVADRAKELAIIARSK